MDIHKATVIQELGGINNGLYHLGGELNRIRCGRELNNEVGSNVTLAFRHLQDAQFRIKEAIKHGSPRVVMAHDETGHVSATATIPPAMPEYQARVYAERDELCEKIQKLSTFLTGGKIPVPPDELDRLQYQLKAMTSYAGILNERIAAFSSVVQFDNSTAADSDK